MKRIKNNTDIKIIILVALLIFIALTQTGCSSEYTDPRLAPYVESVNHLLQSTCGLSVPSDITFKMRDISGPTVGFHNPELDYSAVIVVDDKFYNTFKDTWAMEYLLLHELAHDFKVQHIHGHQILDATTNYYRLATIDPYINPVVLEVCGLLKLKAKLRGHSVPSLGI